MPLSPPAYKWPTEELNAWGGGNQKYGQAFNPWGGGGGGGVGGRGVEILLVT